MLIVPVNLFLMRIVPVLLLFFSEEKRRNIAERQWIVVRQIRAEEQQQSQELEFLIFLPLSLCSLFTFPFHYCCFSVVFFSFSTEFCFHLTCHSFVFSSAITSRLFHREHIAHYKSCVWSPVFERTPTRRFSSNTTTCFFSFYLPRFHTSKSRWGNVASAIRRGSVSYRRWKTNRGRLSAKVDIQSYCCSSFLQALWRRRLIRCCTDRKRDVDEGSSSSMTLSVTGVGELLFEYGCRL